MRVNHTATLCKRFSIVSRECDASAFCQESCPLYSERLRCGSFFGRCGRFAYGKTAQWANRTYADDSHMGILRICGPMLRNPRIHELPARIHGLVDSAPDRMDRAIRATCGAAQHRASAPGSTSILVHSRTGWQPYSLPRSGPTAGPYTGPQRALSLHPFTRRQPYRQRAL